MGALQLLLNKFFDPSTPSMRKGSDGEEEKKLRVALSSRKVTIFLQDIASFVVQVSEHVIMVRLKYEKFV